MNPNERKELQREMMVWAETLTHYNDDEKKLPRQKWSEFIQPLTLKYGVGKKAMENILKDINPNASIFNDELWDVRNRELEITRQILNHRNTIAKLEKLKKVSKEDINLQQAIDFSYEMIEELRKYDAE